MLRHLLPGYKVTPVGAFVGALWAAAIGYLASARSSGIGYGPWLLRETSRTQVGRARSTRPDTGWPCCAPCRSRSRRARCWPAGLFLATNFLWFRYGFPSPNLELLAYYLPGYTSDFGGSLVGAAWIFVYGAVGAAVVAWIYDRVVNARFP